MINFNKTFDDKKKKMFLGVLRLILKLILDVFIQNMKFIDNKEIKNFCFN